VIDRQENGYNLPMADQRKLVADFLSAGPYAVAGASNDRSKYGNKVLRSYLAHGRTAYPVHPKEKVVEGLPAYPDVASLPPGVRVLSIITPPSVTEQLVEAAAKAGIKRIWMQPGAESPAAISRAAELGLSVLAGGPCVLVELGEA
jgi:predicted CoA-binding protein